jgi:hypothetical protein
MIGNIQKVPQVPKGLKYSKREQKVLVNEIFIHTAEQSGPEFLNLLFVKSILVVAKAEP